MCGRYKVFKTADEIQTELFQTDVGRLGLDVGVFEGFDRPRYNIAPTQSVPVIGRNGDRISMVPMRWGLVPNWADDPSIGNRLINARSETAATKPSFRSAWKVHRCLIPADGFYEWTKRGRTKQPLLFERVDQGVFFFAGLWETWTKREGEPLHSCTILTTTPNEMMKPYHDRMPVILAGDALCHWLDPDSSPDELQSLMQPTDPNGWQVIRVSSLVNNPKHDSPECAKPLGV